MVKLIFTVLKTARPRQWLKNVALAVPLIFSGQLFSINKIFDVLIGIFAFCLLSSSNYIFNDIRDIASDQKHPFKRFRPIASGQLSLPIALFTSFIFAMSGLAISISISPSFSVIAATFLLIQYSYTLIFKHMSIIDILVITTLYFLRVYAGEILIGYHISIWLTLSVFSLALFLAVGKRRSELTLLTSSRIDASHIRTSLLRYSEQLLDTCVVLSANSTFITYAYYTFLEKPTVKGFFLSSYRDLVGSLLERKWMMITVPFVLFGIMRYMQLIYEGKGESPEKILTSDIPLLSTIVLWGLSVIWVVYAIGSS
jgi:decaprenyl-phosphate phosphoribosyltransferase